MVNFLLSLLEHDDPNVQTIASEGMAKLMLTGTLVEDDVLKSLILTYMSPYTADHSALRQCLSYFLPLFCSSHVRHQHMVQRVFCDTMDVLVSVYEDASVRSQNDNAVPDGDSIHRLVSSIASVVVRTR